MFTLETKAFGTFNKADVFRINITGDDLVTLNNSDLEAYTNLNSLLLENNRHLKSLDLRGNRSVKYLCLGTCDHLTEIRLDNSAIETIDLYDLVALETIELDDRHLLDLHAMLSDNITKQFLNIEDTILESFERRIAAAEGERKSALLDAYESYLEQEG